MKFIIEPINDSDCRIVDIDCSGLQGIAVGELVIPATVEQDGKTFQVKEVGPKVCFTNKFDGNTAKFASLKRLKKIVFSEGIEVIDGTMNCEGSNADERGNGESLKEVVLPSTIKVIGDNSFNDCRQLSDINVPDSVEVIGKNAFQNCSQLTLFQWPKSLRKIGEGAFADMNIATDENGNVNLVLEIPDTIEEISNPYRGRGTYFRCNVSAKAWPVLDASDMTGRIFEMDIPEGVTRAIGHYHSLQKVTLPSTLEEIGDSAFKNSYALDCIQNLPPNLKSIGNEAFRGAKRSEELKELRIPSADIIIGENAFINNKNLKMVGDEAALKNLMKQPGALNGTLIDAIDIPEGATEVNVSDCPELKRLSIPDTVVVIKKIENCPKLEELIIPDSVTEIREIYDLGIKTIRLSENLVQLYSLEWCQELKKLDLPASLKKLKDDPSDLATVFWRLKAEINAPLDVWKLICSNTRALGNYEYNGELTIPEGVETLADSLFSDSSLVTVNLPSTLLNIGDYCFKCCNQLKSLTIPAGVEVIPERMASECSALESIEFAQGSQLKEIKYAAFEKTALKNVVLPDGFSKLGGEVFKDIETLETVTFPASMTDYGFKASQWGDVTTPFVRCKNLKYVVFLADDPATAVYPIALGKLCDWYVPDNMVDHVKAFIEKAKAENPNVKGVGAKSVKPLSKLKGAEPVSKKTVTPKKATALTQAIQMEAFGLTAWYRFAVDPADVPLLENSIDRAILAKRYLKDKLAECSFDMEDLRGRGPTWTIEELSLETKVNSATDKQWHQTPKSTVKLDFTDEKSLPEDFPATLAKELAQAGNFNNLIAAKCPSYWKDLPADAPAYLQVRVPFRVVFDFMIGEKEKFNVKKITVMDSWAHYDHTRKSRYSCCRFAFMYNGRFIPATKVTMDVIENHRIKAFRSADFKEEISCKGTQVTPAWIGFESFELEQMPFANQILSLVK